MSGTENTSPITNFNKILNDEKVIADLCSVFILYNYKRNDV